VSAARRKKDQGAGSGGGRPKGSASRRDGLPRRVGEVLSPALDRIATGDEARAYSAWARAVGEPVSGGTRPKAFSRGRLTVECASSVWANELTYLGPQILRRMDEMAPGHPVERFRFVVGHVPGSAPEERRRAADEAAPSPASGAGKQDSDRPEEKKDPEDERPAPGAYDPARTQAQGVRDERLRAAIEAALRRSSEGPPGAPGRGTPAG
jgi:hypothetical protein